MRKTKIGFISLGCPKNQIDTEIMLHELMEAGYEITPEDIKADIIIVNICAFITSAKKEAIDNILDVAWLKRKRLRGIIVTGCLAERYQEQLLAEMPEVDAVLGTGSIHDIVDAVRSVDERTKDMKKASGDGGISDGDADVAAENAIYESACKGTCCDCEDSYEEASNSDTDISLKYRSFRPQEELRLGGDRVVTTPGVLCISENC